MGLTLMGLGLSRSVDDAIDRAEFHFGDVLQLDFTVLNDSVQCFYSGKLNISLGSVIVGLKLLYRFREAISPSLYAKLDCFILCIKSAAIQACSHLSTLVEMLADIWDI